VSERIEVPQKQVVLAFMFENIVAVRGGAVNPRKKINKALSWGLMPL
jgi:hypothetical protein